MSFSPEKLARPEILALKPYRPKAAGEGLVRLHVNENPYPGPKARRYPVEIVGRLQNTMARAFGVATENLLVTRGSDDAIDALCRTFCRAGMDNIIIQPPTFSMYEQSAQIQGAGVIEVPLTEEFGLDEAALKAALTNTPNIRLVFACSPLNPTGTLMDVEVIKRLSKRFQTTIFVLDEAYMEFADAMSFTSELDAFPNVVVLKTLSKAFGRAGARIGAVIGNPEVLELTGRVLPPYGISTPAAETALEALSPAGLARMDAEVSEIKSERERVFKALKNLPGIQEIITSQANFLLVKFEDPKGAFKNLCSKGLLVRDQTGAVENGLRITIGTPAENDLLIAALGGNAEAEKKRTARVERTTKETSIFIEVNLDTSSPVNISTGVGFFDHMLEQLAKHSGIAMTIQTKGDTEIDAHHTVEDTMLALGEALKKALGDKKGIGRYGFSLPMDEARADVVLDLSGREFPKIELEFKAEKLGDLPTEMIPHAFASLASSLKVALHVRADGDNDHHKAEGAFKALARALKMAVKVEGSDLPTTKGVL